MSIANEPRSGRKVDEWKMRPAAHDNHWFDGVVGCAVARTLVRPMGSPTANLPSETLCVSLAHFVDVRLRARRNRHGAGAQARQAKGEAVGA